MKRSIVHTENGPALIQNGHGVSSTVIGAKDMADLDVTDAQWDDLHTKLQTGKLKFATVKKTLGKSEQAQ